MTKVKKLSFDKFLLYICTFDLILCGSGRIITIGSLSSRVAFLSIILLYEIAYYLSNTLILSRIGVHVFLFIGYLCINASGSLLFNNASAVVSRFLQYFPFVLYPFFVKAFNHFNDDEMEAYHKFFETCCFCLAIFELLLWCYCFLHKASVYNTINAGLLQHFNYGDLSFIAGEIPRVWFKTSLYTVIGYAYVLNRLLTQKTTTSDRIKLLIYILSILVTFTIGFYIACIAVTLLLLLWNQDKRINLISHSLYLSFSCNFYIEKFSYHILKYCRKKV